MNWINEVRVGAFVGLLLITLAATSQFSVARSVDCSALAIHDFCVFSVSTGDLRAIAFSPDGSKIAMVGNQFRARILNVPDGLTYKASLNNNEFGNALSFSPDGSRLAVGGANGISVWNISTDDRVFLATEASVESLSYSPSGTKIAVGLANGNIQMWDLVTREIISSAVDNNLPFGSTIVSIEYSSDGSMLATNSVAGSKIWNAEDLSLMHTLVADLNFPLGNIDFSPDGRYIAHSEKLPSVPLWEIGGNNSYELIRRFPTMANGDLAASSAEFSPDGQRIAVGAFDYVPGSPAIRLWNVNGGDLAEEFFAIGRLIEDVRFSSSGNYLAAISDSQEGALSNHLLLWRLR